MFWNYNNSCKIQINLLDKFVKCSKNTLFGLDHKFKDIKNYEDFKSSVPIRNYEDLFPYIYKSRLGLKNILWNGNPIYFIKTSGTSFGAKYIPVTSDSIKNHIFSVRNILLNYVYKTKKVSFLNGKMLFLSGNSKLSFLEKIPVGRLSGIINYHIPKYLLKNKLPSYDTNCILDWEEKIDKIINESFNSNITLISGIPPWIKMFFDKLFIKFHKKIKDIFKNFSLLIHGGVNFQPYSNSLFNIIGKKIDTIETYPASEGFIAFQDSQKDKGLLLQLNNGIFFEFIKLSDYYSNNIKRLSIIDIEINVNYVIILNSNNGLWGYILGDTVKFLSKYPYRIIITGRINSFISAFGEHVILDEVEESISYALSNHKEVLIYEFTIAPYFSNNQNYSCHEWFIEFINPPEDIFSFSNSIEKKLKFLNPYYSNLINFKILNNLKIVSLKKNSFISYMKFNNKLGGQNKVPKLCNDRTIANDLLKYKL